MVKEYTNLEKKLSFPVYLCEVDGWDELINFSAKTDNFVLLLLADFSRKTIEEIASVAKRLIDNGLKHICCWGPENTLGHMGFDLGNIEWEEENENSLHVTSTCHDEPLAEAVWYCLYCANPDDEYWTSCSKIIMNVNGRVSASELDRLLSNIDHLNSESGAT